MTGRAGKTRNIWLTWLIWPLITLGIYHFVWYYKINREARDFDENIDVQPELSLLAVLIGWIIIVPPFVSIYRTGERIAQMQEDAGMERSCSGVDRPGARLLRRAVLALLPVRAQPDLDPAREPAGRFPGRPAGRRGRPGRRPGRRSGRVPNGVPDGVPDSAADGPPAGTAAGEPQAARSGGAPGLRPDESNNTGPEDGSSAGN